LAITRGNSFEGYGETMLGTDGSLVLECEQTGIFYKVNATSTNIRISEKLVAKKDKDGKPMQDADGKPVQVPVPAIDERGGDDCSAGVAQGALGATDAGYTAELEHWAATARTPDPKNPLRCTPQQALDNAVIVAAAELAIREGRCVKLEDAWFDLASDEAPGAKAAK
jgi:hypothetical protein